MLLVLLEKPNERNTAFTINDFRPDDLTEAAICLRISKGTLRHWVSDRKIEFIKMGRTIRFQKAHLERFISEKLEETTRKVNRHGIS